MIVGLAGDTVFLYREAATCSVRPRAIATYVLLGRAFLGEVIPTLTF